MPPPPENIVVVRFDSTSIGVSWTKFTLVELKGLANYIVTYNIIISSRKRQTELRGTKVVNWTENQVIISGLQRGAEYDVTVRTSTAAGMSGITYNFMQLVVYAFQFAAPVGPGGRISMTTPPLQTAAGPASSSSDNTVAIIGGVIAVVIVLIIAATAVVIAVLILRNRKAEFKPNFRK